MAASDDKMQHRETVALKTGIFCLAALLNYQLYLGSVGQTNSKVIFVANQVKHYLAQQDLQNLGLQDSGAQMDVKLTSFNGTGEKGLENRVFFLETSGRGYLLPRQACAVESAVRMSGLNVVVLINNQTLDVKRSQLTFTLYQGFPAGKLAFHYIDGDQLVQGTLFEPVLLENSEALKASPYKMTQLSDIYRMAFSFKHGGFYSDMDAVFLKPVGHIKNAVGSEHEHEHEGKCNTTSMLTNCETHIPNGVYHLEAGHPLLKLLMERGSSEFDVTDRGSIGPGMWYETIRSFCGLTTWDHIYQVNNKSCPISVLPQATFYPIPWYLSHHLWSYNLSDQKTYNWTQLFQDSHLVHFYSYLTHSLKVERQRKYEAYSYLGPKYCPWTYNISKWF